MVTRRWRLLGCALCLSLMFHGVNGWGGSASDTTVPTATRREALDWAARVGTTALCPQPDLLAAAPLPSTVGYGTCCSVGDEAEGEVRTALAAGYRLVDTARHYNNEGAIGAAVRGAIDAGVLRGRGDVHIVTKVWFDEMGFESTAEAVEDSVVNLGLGFVDTVLIHFPGGVDTVQTPKANQKLREETWRALEEMQRRGLVRNIGVSNFMHKHLKGFLPTVATRPQVNQIEVHPYCQQRELIEECQAAGMRVMAFCPFAHAELAVLDDPVITAIAHEKSTTAAQVILRWLLQEGVTPVARTVDPGHLKANLAVFDFQLADADMDRIRALDRRARVGFNPNLIA